MREQPLMASVGEGYHYHDAGQQWTVSWHDFQNPPQTGKPHGSAGICFTTAGQVVLVSHNQGNTWGLPGGRPVGNETWQETFERELIEEACASVIKASLLGFAQGICLEGHEIGLVLVRAAFCATVDLMPWEPRYETTHRRLVDSGNVLTHMHFPIGASPIYQRWIHEALCELERFRGGPSTLD